jgi:large subunit ribosomal protein L17
MCIIELVDYNENLLTVKDTTAKKAVRRRKPAAKKATDTAEAPVAEKAPKAKAKVAEKVEEVEVTEEVAKKSIEDEAQATEGEEK